MTLLAVMAAGALGAASRYVVDQAVTRARTHPFPGGTLVVNVLGSAAAGVLAGLAAHRGLDATVRVVAGTGFLGAFTTFSTFAVETVRLAGEDRVAAAAANIALNLVLSTGAAAAAYALATAG